MGHIQIASAHPGSLHIPDFVKILLSAFFVFPMFFWIHFPSLDILEGKRGAKYRAIKDSKVIDHTILNMTKDGGNTDSNLQEPSSSQLSHHDPLCNFPDQL